MAAGMAQAREMIMNNPNMTEEQKAQAMASIGASMQQFKQMQDGSAADKAAIAPYRAQLDTMFENDGANRRMRRQGSAPQHSPTMAAPQSKGGAGGVKARLSKLKGLFDAGLITKQEYDAKRSAILSEL